MREERLGHRRRALDGAEVDQQEVGHRWPDRPAQRHERVAQAGPLPGDAGQVVVEDVGIEERLGHERDRHGRHRTGWPIRVERGDELAAGDREPDPQPGQRVGLARGADDDQVRVLVAQPDERRPDELGVCLVEDDDRGGPACRGGVLGEPDEQVADRAVGLGQRGRVVRAAQPHHRRVQGGGARGRGVERPARLLAASRDRGHLGAALLGEDPVHRIAGDRHDGPSARRDVRLGHDVEDLVGSGPDEDLRARHAIAGGGGLDQTAVVGRRIFGQRRRRTGRPPADAGRARAGRARCSGRTGRCVDGSSP